MQAGASLGLYIEWLCHEVLDMAGRRYHGIVDDCHFAGTGIPLGVHHTFHVLYLCHYLLMRVVTAHPKGAGLHVWTIGMLMSIKVRRSFVHFVKV